MMLTHLVRHQWCRQISEVMKDFAEEVANIERITRLTARISNARMSMGDQSIVVRVNSEGSDTSNPGVSSSQMRDLSAMEIEVEQLEAAIKNMSIMGRIGSNRRNSAGSIASVSKASERHSAHAHGETLASKKSMEFSETSGVFGENQDAVAQLTMAFAVRA